MRCPEAPRLRNEQGTALAVAVFALAVMGGLVAGNFVAGLLEQQSARNTLFTMQAADAAEAELQEAVLQVPASTLSALPVGGAPASLGSVSFNGVLVERQVLRLTERLFLLRSRASRLDADGAALATRMLGLLIKLTADSTGAASGVVPLAQRPWVQLY